MEEVLSRRDEALCEELEEVARRLGVKVHEETLQREAGYRVRFMPALRRLLERRSGAGS